MSRELNRLTALTVAIAKPGQKGTALHTDGGGLYLQVTTTGAKSWVFRYTFGGKPDKVGLGAIHTVDLGVAREQARDLRQIVNQGGNPRIYLQKQRAAVSLSQEQTFRACANEFIKKLAPEHKSAKAHAQWASSLETYAYPTIGDVPIADIDVHMIRELLTKDGLWLNKHETMARVRGRIERVIGWATVLGMRTGDNPARYSHFLSEVLPKVNKRRKVRHHPSVPYALLPEFMAKLRAEPESVSRLALEFLILTVGRTSEVIGAAPAEVTLSNALWVVPAERMKVGLEHRVPLSEPALRVLNRITQLATSDAQTPYYFFGAKRGRPISNMAMLQLMRGMRERNVLTVEAVPHGFRSTFRTWVAEMTTHPRELGEAALAHTIGDATERAYQRGDLLARRRQLMDDWAAYCAGSTA